MSAWFQTKRGNAGSALRWGPGIPSPKEAAYVARQRLQDRRELKKPKATDITPPLQRTVNALGDRPRILDVGCLGWKMLDAAPRSEHFGVDFQSPDYIPDGVHFEWCDVDRYQLPFADDTFDLVVASHLLEHITNAIGFAGEMIRVTKPGGYIYIEAPSDVSARPAPFASGQCAFLNFWDDPTHVRPWPPRALYRLLLGYRMQPLEVVYDRSMKARLTLPLAYLRYVLDRNQDKITGHYWAASGFTAHAIGAKAWYLRGRPAFEYISLKGKTEAQAVEAYIG